MNEINKFISSLNDNQKKLLVITVVIVMASLFDRLLIDPTMSRLSAIEGDIAKEEATIKQDMRFLGYKDRIAKESQEIGPYLTKNMLSDDEMIAAFLNKITNLTSRTKISCKVNSGPGEQEAEYWKYQADLDCTGNLSDVVSFMHLVNSDTDLMKVDKFNFSAKKSDTDEIKAAMTIERIVVTDKPMPSKAKDANAPSINPPAAA